MFELILVLRQTQEWSCCGSETSLLCAYQEEKKAAIAKADAAKKAAEEEAVGSQAAQRFWSPVQRPSVLKSIRGCKAKWRCAESKKRSRDCSFREEECLDGCSWNQAACDQLICESAKKHSREASVCLFVSAFSMSTSIVLQLCLGKLLKRPRKQQLRQQMRCGNFWSSPINATFLPCLLMWGHCSCERKSGRSVFEGQKGSTGYGASRG